VVLNGSVQSEEQKRQIESLAQSTLGVVAVNNQLQIIAGPTSKESNMDNQPSNPLLNPTSNGSSSNSLPRLYKEAGNDGDNSTNSVLSPTSISNRSDKIYHQNGQGQTTNSNQMP